MLPGLREEASPEAAGAAVSEAPGGTAEDGPGQGSVASDGAEEGDMRQQVQMYARWESARSLPKVANNIARVLSSEFDLRIWSTESPWAFPDRAPMTDEVFRVGHTAARRHKMYENIPPNVHIELRQHTEVVATSFVYPDALLAGWMRYHRRRYPGFVCEALEILNQWQIEANKNTAVWVPSHYCKQVFEQAKVIVPIYVIHHGVEPEFKPLENASQLKPEQFTFLMLNTVAHFHYRKGILDGLRAFQAAFPREQKDVQLLLRSPMFDELRETVTGLGDDRIIVQEPKNLSVSAPAMNRLFNNVHALFVPSRGEGFGLPALEAKAAGIPVVGTFWHGSRDHYRPDLDVAIQPSKKLCRIPISEEETGHSFDLDFDSMVAGLRKVHEEYDARSAKSLEAAPEIARQWRWREKLQPLVRLIKTGSPV